LSRGFYFEGRKESSSVWPSSDLLFVPASDYSNWLAQVLKPEKFAGHKRCCGYTKATVFNK
jgi:hypothetical protein